LEVGVAPLDVCGLVFGRPYMYIKDAIFMRRENQYYLIKDGDSFIINAHKSKCKNSMVSSNQAKKIISSSTMFSFLFSRHNQQGDELVKVKEF
jgi:hypothetical protein